MASQRITSDPPLAGLVATLTIHQAKDLLAKDRNFLGKRTSSDPYVKIFYLSPGESPDHICQSSEPKQPIGKTAVKKKNLNPEWNHKLKHAIGANDAESIRSGSPNVGNALNAKQQLNHAAFLLVLFDHDQGTSDDVLGQAIIPISYSGISSQWFTLQTGAPKTKFHCKKTKGEVQVSMEVAPMLLPDIVRGNVVPLKIPHDKSFKSKKGSLLRVGLGWEVAENQAPIDLDISCVAISNDGQVLLDESVYFANLRNPNGSIVHSGDEREGRSKPTSSGSQPNSSLLSGSDDREVINMDMNHLPDFIAAYILLVTVATPGVDFSQVTSARVRISNAESGIGLCAFRPAYEGANSAVFLLRIARKKGSSRKLFGGKKPSDLWDMGTIGDTDQGARDFGSLIPEIKGYCRDLIPDIQINPNERMAIMNKGATVRVRDYTPQRDVLPPVLAMGLAWDVTDGVNIDLDASAVCLDANLQMVDLVYFKSLHSADGSIHHSGDEREGDALGDDEKIIVALNAVDPNTEHIVFVINSYSEQELDDISMASCHLFDPQSRKDLATYTLTNNSALDKHTACLLADLYRDKQTRDWMMRILSVPSQGKTARRCLNHIENYLRAVPPAPAGIPPNPDVVMNEMPVAVPLDQEVAFNPEEDIVVAVATPVSN